MVCAERYYVPLKQNHESLEIYHSIYDQPYERPIGWNSRIYPAESRVMRESSDLGTMTGFYEWEERRKEPYIRINM